jgi:hypothetical protein
MTPPAALVQLVEPWSRLYADSTAIATAVVYGHVAALLFAGGQAVTLDRGTLRAARDESLRPRQLGDLAAAHPLVIGGLTVSVLTGLLLFTADLESYYGSPVFWTKMALIALLLANGYRMTRAEAQLRAGADDAAAAWRRLRATAVVSLALWFLIVLAGVALVNAV